MTEQLLIPASLPNPSPPVEASTALGRWLTEHRVEQPEGPETTEETAAPQPWWKVACLTGVDYFSTLAYLPGIAALAAGALSPLATLLIVALTLLGMLPMYRRVAQESPHGQGSVSMLERLLPFWRGKIVVLVLLGFVATSWIITITLSAADASVHLVENPLTPHFLHGSEVFVTIGFIGILGGVFLLGFSEAVAVAVPLVAFFLLTNAVVVVDAVRRIIADPDLLSDWTSRLTEHGGGFGGLVVPALLAFPLLVLGLSGFETGVSMMPLVAAQGETPAQRLASRIKNSKKLLTLAAGVMSVMLIVTSFVTTILIPEDAFKDGGPANGRAIAYLAHTNLGDGFGTAYDLSTVLILWFAGASAMAGLINIVPRYLPSYGMAPDWTRSIRPVVLLYTAICVLVTVIFNADVNAQAGAYATGVLAMMVSGTGAVTISAWRQGSTRSTIGFGILTAIMIYALFENVKSDPSGIHISGWFIAAIIGISLISRVSRTTELRADSIEFDEAARRFITETIEFDGQINLIANRRQAGDVAEYASKEVEQRGMNPVPGKADVLFVEVDISDHSGFGGVLEVEGIEVSGYRILRTSSPAAPNAIAAILLAVYRATGVRPHCHFEWSEGNPLTHLMRYLLLGRGDTAPVVREIIRQAEPDPKRRPAIHVGG